jgi:DNA-binding beta-propeller fold protein YncE
MRVVAAALAALVLAVSAAYAQIAISANDGKAVLVDGVNTVPANPEPDNVTIIKLAKGAPRVLGEVQVPTSVIGPPESVAIAPDSSYALVTAATKIDPKDASKTVPCNLVSVLDLKSFKVIQTLEAGLGASGVSINRAGTLALVAGRADDTVSIFTIADKKLTAAGTISFDAKSGPSLAVFTPDGTKALLTRDGDSKISVLTVDGARVVYTGYDISAGLHPYSIKMSRKGDIAIAANMAVGGRDNGSLSVIDLKSAFPHVVNTANVAPSPEGLALSADGKYVAASSLNGSNFAPGTLGFHDFGLVQVFKRDGFKLKQVASERTGHWCEGAAWSANHRTLLVQCMVEKEIQVFSFDGKKLKRSGAIPVHGGPAGISVAD